MYVDEMGCMDLKSGRYYVITGVIVHESQLNYIESQIKKFKEENFTSKLYRTMII